MNFHFFIFIRRFASRSLISYFQFCLPVIAYARIWCGMLFCEQGIDYLHRTAVPTKPTNHFRYLVRERVKSGKLGQIGAGSEVEHDCDITNPPREDCSPGKASNMIVYDPIMRAYA